MSLPEPKLTDHLNRFPELCSGIPTCRCWLFLEPLWEQDAREPVCREAWAPSCRTGLGVSLTEMLPLPARSTAPPLLRHKVKRIYLSPVPKTRSNKRYKKESWSAHLVNSDLRGQLCHSCGAAPTPSKLSCWVSNRNTRAFHIGFDLLSLLDGVIKEGRDGHCSPLNRSILLLTETRGRFWKRNLHQEDI